MARFRPRRLRDACGCIFESLEPRSLLAAAIWDGGPGGLGTDWHDPVNWKGDTLPVSGDDVFIVDGPGIAFSLGTLALHSLSSERPLTLLGGKLGVSSISSVGNLITLDGGALAGGPWDLSGPGLVVTPNTANALEAASINGDLSLADAGDFLRINGGLTLNGLILISGEDAAISFAGGNQTLGGNADIAFSGFVGTRYISADGGAMVTFASGVQVSGTLGSIVSGRFSGSGSFINQGTIWSDVDNGSIEIAPSLLANLGTLRASGSSNLRINASSWTNSGVIATIGGNVHLGGTFDATGGAGSFSRNGGEVYITGTILNTGSTLTLNAATGNWRLRGGRVIGGTVVATASGSLQDYPFSSGELRNLTFNGNFTWQSAAFNAEFESVTINGNGTFGNFSTLIVRNNLTLNGVLTVTGAETLVQFSGTTQELIGNATLQLRNEDAFLWPDQTLTIRMTASVSGFGRLYGNFVNYGTVAADTAGKRLLFGQGTFQNNNMVSATAGKLWIGVPSGVDAQFINNGTLIASGSAIVALAPTLDSGSVTFTNKGSMYVANSAQLTVGAFHGLNPVTFVNSGSLQISDDADATIGSLQAFAPITLNNSGVISVNPGASLAFESVATTEQLGDLRAAGGTVTIKGVINNDQSTLTMGGTSGSWVVDGGAIRGGVVSFGGGAQLLFTPSTSNLLDGVTIVGGLAVSQGNARIAITNGLTLQGSITVSGQDAAIWFDGGTSLVSGSGSIFFAGEGGSQTLSADDGAQVTLGSGVEIVGLSGAGQLRSGLVVGGAGSFTNLGVIAGKVAINSTGFTNLGTVEARGGHTLVIEAPTSNLSSGILSGGTWKVTGPSTLSFGGASGIQTNNATISITGAGANWMQLSSLSANKGSLTLSQAAALTLSGPLSNHGVITLGPAAALHVPAFIQLKRGVLNMRVSAQGAPLLQATGVASLYGTMNVSWVDGFSPVSGTYTFVSAQSVRGRFASVAMQPVAAASAYRVQYTSSSMSVVVYRMARP